MPRSRVRRLVTTIVVTSFLALAGLLSLWQQVDQACRSDGVVAGSANVVDECEAAPIAEGPGGELEAPVLEAAATTIGTTG